VNTTASITAVTFVAVATLLVGFLGLRFSRTTSDFYVASRSISPAWNASAIGGEYLSAGSFLGVAGLILVSGADMLWYPVGWTTGYLVLLVLVSAPLRRSGAYTLPDFADVRLQSAVARRVSSVLVVLIGWLYLLPQFQGAGITLSLAAGAPAWLGGVVVAGIVLVSVLSGGMRSITFVQAFQFWLKLTALLVPLVFLLLHWRSDGSPSPVSAPVGSGALPGESWVLPLASGTAHPLYATYSLILATFLGTMGLPHVLVRFYTNPDGRAARRTTLIVLMLLGAFYLLPAVYGALGRIYAADLITGGESDTVVLTLPARMIGGTPGELLTALLVAGAFAAFLSTSSGLTISVSGVLSQDVVFRWVGGVTGFRLAAVVAVGVPLTLSLLAQDLAIATLVGMAFALAASTFCPLLVLGIWWRRLTDAGAVAGLLTGGLLAGASVVLTIAGVFEDGWTATLLVQPAAWSVPVAFAVMVLVSLATPRRIAPDVARTMVRLHTPEQVEVDRGDWQPRALRARGGARSSPRSSPRSSH
jgi:Na+(H+)/acetate symporter ActP